MRYQHGGDIYTYKGTLDFSVNVNPLGPSKEVMGAAARSIEECGNYPDSRCRRLKEAIRDSLGLCFYKTAAPEPDILTGNGAADLFYSLVLAEKPGRALIPVPAFSEYERALDTVECETEYYETRQEDNFRLTEAFLERLKQPVDIVFLCFPSNPAGQAVEAGLLTEIVKRCEQQGIRLVLDECFVDFLASGTQAEMSIELMRENKCLFLVRAFTKINAIPGLRLGYGLTSDAALAEKLERARQPWSVSIPAQAAGVAALTEPEELRRTKEARELVKRERSRIEAALRDCGMKVIPSEANFLLFQSEYPMFELLLEKNILIRDCSDYRGLKKGWYRAAVKLPEENACLIRAVRDICVNK